MNSLHKVTDFGAIVFKNEIQQEGRSLVVPLPGLIESPICNAVLGSDDVRLVAIGIIPYVFSYDPCHKSHYLQHFIFDVETFPFLTDGKFQWYRNHPSEDRLEKTNGLWKYWYTAEAGKIILNLQYWDNHREVEINGKSESKADYWQAKVGLGYGRSENES